MNLFHVLQHIETIQYFGIVAFNNSSIVEKNK